jgi:hypothetical protein
MKKEDFKHLVLVLHDLYYHSEYDNTNNIKLLINCAIDKQWIKEKLSHFVFECKFMNDVDNNKGEIDNFIDSLEWSE